MIRFVASSGSSVTVDIVERLAVNPYVTINKIAEDLGVAYSTAQRGIQKLEAANIILNRITRFAELVYQLNESLIGVLCRQCLHGLGR